MSSALREYKIKSVIAFSKTNGHFGVLSNMAPGFNLFVNEINIQDSEVLYQVCRFPLFPDIQEEIIKAQDSIESKRISEYYLQYSRQDWNSIKYNVMRWCLAVKLIQNFDKFSRALLATGDMQIVESSIDDAVWGAVPKDYKSTLIGKNALGRLLMELREKIKAYEIKKTTVISPPPIPGFLLFGNFIEEVRNDVFYIPDLKSDRFVNRGLFL